MSGIGCEVLPYNTFFSALFLSHRENTRHSTYMKFEIWYIFILSSCIEYALQEKINPVLDTGQEETGIIEPVPPLDCSVTKQEVTDIDQNLECTTTEYNIVI